jgi:hypothetical protein
MNTDVVPPLAANMSAAFKKVTGAIGDTDRALRDQIATRISQKMASTTSKSYRAARLATSSRKGSPGRILRDCAMV